MWLHRIQYRLQIALPAFTPLSVFHHCWHSKSKLIVERWWTTVKLVVQHILACLVSTGLRCKEKDCSWEQTFHFASYVVFIASFHEDQSLQLGQHEATKHAINPTLLQAGVQCCTLCWGSTVSSLDFWYLLTFSYNLQWYYIFSFYSVRDLSWNAAISDILKNTQ